MEYFVVSQVGNDAALCAVAAIAQITVSPSRETETHPLFPPQIKDF